MTALQSSLQSMNVTEIRSVNTCIYLTYLFAIVCTCSLWRTDIDVTNLSLLIDTIPQVQTKLVYIMHIILYYYPLLLLNV